MKPPRPGGAVCLGLISRLNALPPAAALCTLEVLFCDHPRLHRLENLPKLELMPLTQLDLPTTLDTSTVDMTAVFYEPALSVSVRYDRGVGFFSSGWLQAFGLAKRLT